MIEVLLAFECLALWVYVLNNKDHKNNIIQEISSWVAMVLALLAVGTYLV